MFLLHNGHLLPATVLPLPNRGLAYGDGFFETLIFTNGRLRLAPDHTARMQRAAAALGLTLPPALATAEALTATLGQLSAANHLPAARLRVQLWRGGGGRYAPPTDAAEWLATAEPFTPDNSPVATAGFAESVRTMVSPVSFCKGPHAVLYVLAAQERVRRGLDELLLLDAAGHVAEAVAAAVFWISEGQLFTPCLTTGCVAGVQRAHLLQVARQHGVKTHEVLMGPAKLQNAEIVFTANVAGIRAVQRLDATAYSKEHPLLERLRQLASVSDNQASSLNSIT